MTHKISHPSEIGDRTVVQIYNAQVATAVDNFPKVELADQVEVCALFLAPLITRHHLSAPFRAKRAFEHGFIYSGTECSDEMVLEALKQDEEGQLDQMVVQVGAMNMTDNLPAAKDKEMKALDEQIDKVEDARAVAHQVLWKDWQGLRSPALYEANYFASLKNWNDIELLVMSENCGCFFLAQRTYGLIEGHHDGPNCEDPG